MLSQRPVWPVDELFTSISHIETRLNKLDQIGTFCVVNSMNMKVIKVDLEQETKALSKR